MCSKPITVKGDVVPCGQCMPCRFNKRRVWSTRLFLESLLHRHNLFVTLTYDDDHFPEGGSVYVRELQLYIKRLRDRLTPVRFRYFGVGEYGDISFRPHYHVALFGVSEVPSVQLSWCDYEGIPKGFVHIGILEPASCEYIAGYVTKKMTKSDDIRLGGRYPEFCRMSNRPGIGAGAVAEISRVLCSESGSANLVSEGDVPVAIRIGGKLHPLGRFLRGKLREAVGWDSPNVPESTRELRSYLSMLEAKAQPEEFYTRWQRRAIKERQLKFRMSLKGKKL